MTKKKLLAVLLSAVMVLSPATSVGTSYTVQAADTVDMYRLYNPNSGEHFYTASQGERNHLVEVGWNYEGIGWTAPKTSKTAVYRLYNPNAGDHHYTTSVGERDYLVRAGWNNEGIGWYSDDSKRVPLYRQYNPNAKTGTHNYTTNRAENDMLIKAGWNAEGIGWYAVGAGRSDVYQSQKDQTIANMLAKTKTAQKTDQIILVIDRRLSLWNRQSNGTWLKSFESDCGYGSNGLSANRTAGDKTTPIGSYPIQLAFGLGTNPGTSMTYRQITRNSYWADNGNMWVESTTPVSGEHLIDYYQYKYAMAIGFNSDPFVKGKGSAIFIHCKSRNHWSTAGCVSLPEDMMLRLMKESHNGEYVIIVPSRDQIANY